MTSLTQDIQDKLKRLSAFEKIIILNFCIYILGWFIWKLTDVSRDNSMNWLALPKELSEFIVMPWTIFTYGFVHIDLWHIVFNMLVLYFVGRSFSNLFNTKLSLNIYFLGILSGGLLFLLVALLVPDTYFANVSGLIGASAGVHAALLFLCAYMPEYEIVLVRFRIKLKYLAMAFILFDVIGLFGDNRGGNVAHIGGDLLGIYYALQLQKGKDIGKRFEGIANIFVSWFSWSKKSQLKTVHKKKNAFAGHSAKEFKSFNNQKQIDIILDKISKSGYDSLNAEEKEFLFKAGKK